MMISAASTIGMSASRIPQQGICMNSPISLSNSLRRRRAGLLKWSSGSPMGRGDNTWAIKQASSSSSFFSSAGAHASDDEVPANWNTGATGTKTVELMDPISPATPELAFAVDDQLPPLLSMVIDGFPPLQQSKYVHEADQRLHQYAERYPNATSLYEFCRVGLSISGCVYKGITSVDRLVAISISYGLLYVLDDLFFDNPDESLHHQYGINRDALGSVSKTQEWLDRLDAVFSQQVQPRRPAPLIETLMWELGGELLELSNPEWFKSYIASVVESHHTDVASLANLVQGPHFGFQDLKSYSAIRAINCGGKYIQLMIEFANNTYIPSTLKATPYFEKVTMATTMHLAFSNDIFSYHMESSLEQNPRNLITVLMECEGKSFDQAVHTAIGFVNTYAHALMDLEAEAWNPTLRNHLQDTKALIAGGLYYSYMDKRYRHPDSIFPELRDMTCSAKSLLHAISSRL